MLFVGDAQEGLVRRAAVVGALVGLVRSLRRPGPGAPTALLGVERYTGHEPGGAYAELGFRRPVAGATIGRASRR